MLFFYWNKPAPATRVTRRKTGRFRHSPPFRLRATINSPEKPLYLGLSSSSELEACNGGLFVSSGWGSHPARILESYELILLRSGTLQLREEQSTFRLVDRKS